MVILSKKIVWKIFSYVRNKPCRHYSLLRKAKETSNKFSPYIILKANKEDYQDIIKIMHESYYNDEPTCFSIGLFPNTIMDETVMQKLAEGVSLVARCKYDGCIMGAAVNETSNPWDPDLKEKLACNVQCPKMKHWLLFQAHVQRSPKLWDCLGVQKVFEITHAFTGVKLKDTDFIKKLLEESRSLAADCGYKVVRMNASTKKMSDMCESLKMKVVDEIQYCSYLGRNMEPIFNPPQPNGSLKIYIDQNPQENSKIIKKK